MKTFPNDNGMNEVHIKTEATVYCPLGKDFCKIEIEAWVENPEMLADFLDVYDHFTRELNGKEYTREQLTDHAFGFFMETYKPEHLKVRTFGAYPLWVEVTKSV